MTSGSSRPLRRSDFLRFGAIALLLLEGGIHLQQYEGFLHSVPTINTLFLMNAIAAGVIALALAASRDQGAILVSLAAIGMTLVAMISLAIARVDLLFDYSEPTLRDVVVLNTLVELGAVVMASAFVFKRLGELRWEGSR